jgi:SAM-dependent methyltransferase
MATTCPATFDVALLRQRVRETYTAVAEAPGGDFHFHRGAAYAAELLGYDAAELAALPAEATDAFAGVGRPFAAGVLRPGAVVLDHACGAGMDLLLAARRVGPDGRAIGVDLTAAMVARARRAVAAAGLGDRIDVVQGAYEALPVPDASVDVLLSNGVLNLAPDKRRVLGEVARVLRRGGQLWISDVVVQRELTLAARSDAELWAACVAGALPEAELLGLLPELGFTAVRLAARHDCFRGTSAAARTAQDLRIGAITVTATRT